MSGSPSAVPSTNQPKPAKPRWYAPTIAKVLFALLALQVVLYLSQQFEWFWFNRYKGYTVVVTAAATILLVSLLVGWIAISRFLKARAQFDLATLLLIVPVIAIPFAWFSREKELADQQGKIHWYLVTRKMHMALQDLPYESVESRSSVDKWLRGWLGNDFFSDLTYLRMVKGNDEDLKVLGLHTKMKGLWLVDCDFSDAGVEHLNRMHRLPRIRVAFEKVADTDAPLRRLKRLKKLREVTLGEAAGTDKALEALSGLANLEELRLSGTGITDLGMVHLGGLTSLKDLSLEETSITDVGLKHLAGLTQLQSLSLDGTGVTQDGFEHLTRLTMLSDLSLNRTKVSDVGPIARGLSQAPLQRLTLVRTPLSDAGLEHIEGLSQLKWLDLAHTKITDAGLAHLQGLKRLTRLEIDHNDITDVGLDYLKRVERLKHVEMNDTLVTSKGSHGFKNAVSGRPNDRFAPPGL
jgi:hypothetical protein